VNFTNDLQRVVRLDRPRSPDIVHFYHSRITEWQGTADGMTLPDGREVCVKQVTCTCAPGTTYDEIKKAMRREAMMRSQLKLRHG
jgi:hypothetical protein